MLIHFVCLNRINGHVYCFKPSFNLSNSIKPLWPATWMCIPGIVSPIVILSLSYSKLENRMPNVFPRSYNIIYIYIIYIICIYVIFLLHIHNFSTLFHFSTTLTWGSPMIIPFHRCELFGSRKGPDGPRSTNSSASCRSWPVCPSPRRLGLPTGTRAERDGKNYERNLWRYGKLREMVENMGVIWENMAVIWV